MPVRAVDGVVRRRDGPAKLEDLSVVTPCCHAASNLNDLNFDWPAGFARFQLSAMNPDRPPLTSEELQRVAAVLGHPIRQVLTRY